MEDTPRIPTRAPADHAPYPIKLDVPVINGEKGGMPRPIRLSTSMVLRSTLVLADVAALGLAWMATVGLPQRPASEAGDPTGLVVALSAVAAGIAVISGHRLYRSRVCAIRAVEHRGLARAAAAAGAAAWLAGAAAEDPLSGVQALAGAAGSFLALTAARAVYRAWLRQRRERGSFRRPVLILGEGDDARTLHRMLSEHPELGYDVRGVVGGDEERLDFLAADVSVPVLGEGFSMGQVARALGASGAIVSANGMAPERLNRTVRELQTAKLHVQLSTGLYGIASHRLRATPLSHEPLLYLEEPAFRARQLATKRVMDVALSGALLVVSAPVVAAAAAAVKATDGGPALFRQERVGRHGRHFTVYKLRTMHEDAEARIGDLAAHNEREGPLFKLDADPRVTRVGRLLRASHLDELPQLVNVIRGDMSLVGPRPALPQEVEQFSETLRERTRVRPGITGLWQAEAAENPSFFAYQRLDLHYVENWSLGLDLAILLATVEAFAARSIRVLRTPRGPARSATPGEAGNTAPADTSTSDSPRTPAGVWRRLMPDTTGR